MKNFILPILIFGIAVARAQSDYKNYYEILDAREANKLYNAIKADTTHFPKWPLSLEQVESGQIPFDVWNDLVIVETQIIDDKTTLYKARIRRLQFYGGFRGVIPNVKLDSLESLEIRMENITGIDSGLYLPKLRSLDLYGNKLKSFPKNTFPLLQSLEIAENEMQGSIPADIGIKMPKLESLDASGNQLSGSLNIDLKELVYLSLDDNQLTGTMDNLRCPKLKQLDLKTNRLTGTIHATYPEMEYLFANENQFTGISAGWALNQNLKWLYCSVNHLQFDDLLPLADLKIERFYYGYQQPVTYSTEQVGNKRKLNVQIGGEGNIYTWAYASDSSEFRKFREDSIPFYLGFLLTYGTIKPPLLDTVKGATGNTLEIDGTENPVYYACQITNPRLPDLRMAAVLDRPVETSCWGNDDFYICLLDQGVKWGKGEKNEIKANGFMSINDFLFYNGSLIIDTSTLKFKMDGQLYVKDIELPGGGFGNFVVAGGKYELQLGGKDGRITGFINDALKTYVPEIGGLKIKLNELKPGRGPERQRHQADRDHKY